MTEAKRPLKVFLCHAHADRDAVRALYTRLAKDGVDAWFDKAKLLPGQDWEMEIRKAVREADVVVVCLSRQFNQAGFRQKEVKWALDTAMEQPEGEIFIIPARLEECGTLENLRKWHWVDLFEHQGYRHLSRALQVRAEKIGAVLEAPKSKSPKMYQHSQVEQLSALQEISATINSINSPAELRTVLQNMLENISLQLKVDAVDILLFDPSTQSLNLVLGVGLPMAEEGFASINRDKIGLSISEPRTIRIDDLSTVEGEFIQGDLVQSGKFVAYMSVPLIAKGKVEGFLEIFHRSPLILDDAKVSFIEILADQAALAIDSASLFEDREKANLELTMAYDATIEGWVRVLELRDQDLQGHTSRVVDLTLRLAQAMGLPSTALQDIRRGALLHDIGKMGIPDEILRKPGKLADDEAKILQMHPQNAFNMLAPIAYLHSALDIPYCHHEKWDGTGYPRGLKGEEIPFAARIFAVVDVFDMLATDRPYRKALSKDKILDYIQEQAGKHFDPQVVEAFIKLMLHWELP